MKRDPTICPVGIYHGIPFAEIPESYLLWAVNNTRGSYLDMMTQELNRRFPPRIELSTASSPESSREGYDGGIQNLP